MSLDVCSSSVVGEGRMSLVVTSWCVCDHFDAVVETVGRDRSHCDSFEQMWHLLQGQEERAMVEPLHDVNCDVAEGND
jgi:hypothetical protein